MFPAAQRQQISLSGSPKFAMRFRRFSLLLMLAGLVGCNNFGRGHWTNADSSEVGYLNSDLELDIQWTIRILPLGVDAKERQVGPKCALAIVRPDQALFLIDRKETFSYPLEKFAKSTNSRFSGCYRNFSGIGNFPEICLNSPPTQHSIRGLPGRPLLWDPYVEVWTCPAEGGTAVFVTRDMVLRSS